MSDDEMYRRDTIAAIATPAGSGGIAIVRVSGAQAAQVARRVFPGLPQAPSSHRLYHGPIAGKGGERIDRGLGVWMGAPRSYTGEDVFEIHCHGGSLLARAVLAATLAAGARMAEPGEFTLRAFLNGKLDLVQAEAVADLVSARTPASLRVATAQLEGELSHEIETIRERLVGVAAHLEASIDFSEEDVGDLDHERLGSELAGARQRIASLAATFASGRVLREGARVAIVGKPNVGKSSLLNRLVRSDRAIVTANPGTTRDVIEETIDVDGILVVLLDTAGIREGADEAERLGVERARRVLSEADLALLVLDGSRPLEREDLQILDAMRQIRCILLINKKDLEKRWEFTEVLRYRPGIKILEISALTGQGMDELRRAVADALLGTPVEASGVMVTHERQYNALELASSSLTAVIDSLGAGHPPDIVAVDLMAALDRLGEIVGRTTREDVLDRVFREFCIGK